MERSEHSTFTIQIHGNEIRCTKKESKMATKKINSKTHDRL